MTEDFTASERMFLLGFVKGTLASKIGGDFAVINDLVMKIPVDVKTKFLIYTKILTTIASAKAVFDITEIRVDHAAAYGFALGVLPTGIPFTSEIPVPNGIHRFAKMLRPVKVAIKGSSMDFRFPRLDPEIEHASF